MVNTDSTSPSLVSGGRSSQITRTSAISLVLRPSVLCFVTWALVFCVIAVNYGPEASWDLRNYHLYGPFALLHGRLKFDFDPAQVQTFLPPTLDIPFYGLRFWLNAHPNVLDAVLSLPHVIGAYLTTLIALCFIPTNLSWRWPTAMLLVAVGATGAAGLSTIATSQSEMVPGCLVLGGFLVLLRQLDRGTSQHALITAGLLFGAAAGLKLTSVPYCLGATAAVLLVWPGVIRDKLAAALLFSLSLGTGMIVLGGWWWLHLYRAYGNPLFPFYNRLFHSPYFPFENVTDDRFKPRGWLQALFYPFYWGLSWHHPIAEPVMRDPRFMLTYLAFGATVILRMFRSPDGASRLVGFLLVFFGISYAAWEAQFSILRYLAPIEMLCGIVMFLPLRALVASRRGVATAGLAAAMAGIIIVVLTVYPDWGRAQARTNAIAVDMPRLAPRSLVVLLDDSAMGYLAVFVPRSDQVIGANNPIIHPQQKGLYQEGVDQLIRTYSGPIYGMEDPREEPGMADRTLAYYGLRRGAGCARIRSNLDGDRTVVCPLIRNS